MREGSVPLAGFHSREDDTENGQVPLDRSATAEIHRCGPGGSVAGRGCTAHRVPPTGL